MAKRKFIIIFITLLAFTALSINTYHTGNWLGAVYGHLVLSVTDQNMQRISAHLFLVKSCEVVLADLAKDGWAVIEQDADSYQLKNGSQLKNIIIVDQVSQYYILLIGDAYTPKDV